MSDLADLRVGLAANLAPLIGWAQVSPYVLDNPTPPCVYLTVGGIDYDQAMGHGHDNWTFTVYALVGYVTDIGSQMTLDRMLASTGDESIRTLLMSDPQLGGAAEGIHVQSTTGVRTYTLAGPGQSAPVIGAEWTVLVLARGNN